MLIRTFNCGKGEYLELKSRLERNGWKVVKETISKIKGDWILKCAKKDWFDQLSEKEKIRVIG